MIGEALVKGKPYPLLTEEGPHCGESLLAVVAALWEARSLAAANQAGALPLPGWFLPDSEINDLQQASVEKTVAHAKRARWTNAVVRKDAVETTYEADWVKRMVRVPAAPLLVQPEGGE